MLIVERADNGVDAVLLANKGKTNMTVRVKGFRYGIFPAIRTDSVGNIFVEIHTLKDSQLHSLEGTTGLRDAMRAMMRSPTVLTIKAILEAIVECSHASCIFRICFCREAFLRQFIVWDP